MVDPPKDQAFERFVAVQTSLKMDSSGILVFDLVDLNKPAFEAVYRVDSSKHGWLTPLGKVGSFRYQAKNNPGLADTIRYQVCSGNRCKSGFLFVKPEENTCLANLQADTFNLIWNDTLHLPVLENDQINCVLVSATIESSSVGTAKWKSGGIEWIPPFGYEGVASFRYRVCFSSGVCQSADVRVQVSLPANWCDLIFKPNPDTLKIGPGLLFKTFFASELTQNDRFCQGDLVPSSFTISRYPASGNAQLFFQNNRWWFTISDTSSFQGSSFGYRICNQQGKCDTTTVYILKKP